MKGNYTRALLCLMLAGSCVDPEKPEPDLEAPVVEIFSPERNVIFAPGDTVFIRALLTDNNRLKRGAVHIHDPYTAAASDTVFSFVFDIQLEHFDLDTFWVVNDPKDKSYVIYVDGLDYAENFKESLRFFHQFH